ncbi:hypothetical protein HKX48_000013 [Thoreauomyces humboldtii]|nr:hypothetical protein HKX48_000013 [Thoreauomyces humboldtii]
MAPPQSPTSEYLLKTPSSHARGSARSSRIPPLRTLLFLLIAAGTLLAALLLLFPNTHAGRAAAGGFTMAIQKVQKEPPKVISSPTVAVIIENRPLKNLLPVIIHFAGVLGPTWPIHVFKGRQNSDLFAGSAAIQRLVQSGRIVMHDLPKDAVFSSHTDVSRFLTKPWVWEQLLPADHALLFQADAMLCANSRYRPEDFLQYSLIGAPIDRQWGVGYNGGLSLRHVPSVLRVIEKFDWNQTPGEFEDQWFFARMQLIEGTRLPTEQEAMPFSVETIWFDRPLGYHQPKRWQEARMGEILAYCPEVALAEEGQLYQAALGAGP